MYSGGPNALPMYSGEVDEIAQRQLCRASSLAKTTRAKELWRGAASGVASADGASASKAAPATKVVGFNRAWVDVVVALSFFPVDWLSPSTISSPTHSSCPRSTSSGPPRSR